MEVLPATASLDTTPMENLTALADSAAATSSLQKQVGRFVDSLSDGVHHGTEFLHGIEPVLLLNFMLQFHFSKIHFISAFGVL